MSEWVPDCMAQLCFALGNFIFHFSYPQNAFRRVTLPLFLIYYFEAAKSDALLNHLIYFRSNLAKISRQKLSVLLLSSKLRFRKWIPGYLGSTSTLIGVLMPWSILLLSRCLQWIWATFTPVLVPITCQGRKDKAWEKTPNRIIPNFWQTEPCFIENYVCFLIRKCSISRPMFLKMTYKGVVPRNNKKDTLVTGHVFPK